MTDVHAAGKLSLAHLISLMFRILAPERNFYILAAVYGIGISLLSLALPISVQMLINTVANTGLIAPLFVLSLTLFALLMASGLLNALRIHLMEIFGRRFYARMVSEISLRAMYAEDPFFLDAGKAPLFNRYFDTVIVQKNVPILLIGGFTLVLQAIVGFVLVSLYHPYFLAFNLVFILLIWLVLGVWGPSAMRSAVALSHAKHETAAWLEGLAASNGYYKSERHVAHALDETDAATEGYVEAHKKHFRQHFIQTILLLVVYALASATLLGLGGWLVIQGQLTLGQLVAAELILSAVFAGVAQLSSYLTSFYELVAAIDELALFYDVKQEEPTGDYAPPPAHAQLDFVDARGDARGREAVFNFSIPAGAVVMARASDHGLQRLLSHLLRRHVEPKGGFILFGGADILATEIYALRQQIVIVDRPTLIETTIRDYLRLACANASPAEILDVLRIVGLERTLAGLERGLDTRVAATGFPLSVTEAMQLKVAAAILARPNILVMNQLCDLIPEAIFREILKSMRERTGTTVIVYSHRTENLGYDRFLFLEHHRQQMFDSYTDFQELSSRYIGGGARPVPLPSPGAGGQAGRT